MATSRLSWPTIPYRFRRRPLHLGRQILQHVRDTHRPTAVPGFSTGPGKEFDHAVARGEMYLRKPAVLTPGSTWHARFCSPGKGIGIRRELMRSEQDVTDCTSQDTRKLLSEARAVLPPMSGTIINSRTVTPESST